MYVYFHVWVPVCTCVGQRRILGTLFYCFLNFLPWNKFSFWTWILHKFQESSCICTLSVGVKITMDIADLYVGAVKSCSHAYTISTLTHWAIPIAPKEIISKEDLYCFVVYILDNDIPADTWYVGIVHSLGNTKLGVSHWNWGGQRG